MNDAAWVSLFTGTSTAIGAALGAGWQILGESRRAAHELRRIRDEREAERSADRERRLRRAVKDTDAAAYRLTQTVVLCLHMYRNKIARDESELLARQRQAQGEYIDAKVAIKTLQTMVGEDSAAMAEIHRLRTTLADAYRHVRSMGSTTDDPDELERRVDGILDALSSAVRSDGRAQAPGPHPGAPAGQPSGSGSPS
ncbi:hypothetical protein [Actinoallomurus soli]|uniref:hypothetical protein n=1 Tax=Actinoallomurus soli TaxID=2952535 RepID=UPI0020923979|nr:hypothetical protein [Actinoallomurus soli]MCO5973809.1 hypothetical protein [Actinoallomurus soli]